MLILLIHLANLAVVYVRTRFRYSSFLSASWHRKRERAGASSYIKIKRNQKSKGPVDESPLKTTIPTTRSQKWSVYRVGARALTVFVLGKVSLDVRFKKPPELCLVLGFFARGPSSQDAV